MKDKLKETIPLQIWIIVALVVLVAGGFFAWQKYGVIVKIKNLEIVPSQIIGDSTVYREGAKAIVIGKNLGKVELYQRGGGTEIYTSPEGGFLGAGLKTKTIKGEEKWEIMSLPTERLMKELCAVGFDKKGNKIGDVCLFDVYGEPTGVSGETADWQIYRNEEYGYEVKYPKEWTMVGPAHTGSIYLSSTLWNYTYEIAGVGTTSIYPMTIDVVPKGDQTSQEWILGKSITYPDKWVLGKPLTYYESYKKLKDVIVGGVATQILIEDWEYASGGITFVPKGNYVYIIASGGQLERLQNSAEITITDKILSTFRFLE